jgi:tetratricopeptide (TPR) repeat protein
VSVRFVRRHRLGVIAGVTLLTLLVAFAATMAIQARRIAAERDRANREAATANQIASFLTGLFKVSDPGEARGNSLTAREVLDKGARDVETTLVTQPDVQARLQATIGTVYTNLGLYQAAETQLRQSLDTRARVLGPDAPEAIATAHMLANLYYFRHRYSDAERLYGDVIAKRRRGLGDNHPDTLHAQFDLASAYIVMGEQRWPDAERLGRDTLARQRRVLGDQHPDTIESMANLATVYMYQGRHEEAEPLYVAVLDANRRRLGDDHPDTLLAMHNVANNMAHLGQYADAERLFQQTFDRKRRVLGERHPLTAWTRVRLVDMYFNQRRHEDAEAQYLAAYEVLAAAFWRCGRADPDRSPSADGTVRRLGQTRQIRGMARKTVDRRQATTVERAPPAQERQVDDRLRYGRNSFSLCLSMPKKPEESAKK